MNKKLIKGAILLPFIILILWVIMLQSQTITGKTIKLYVNGYDPRDILSGHYLSLSIDIKKNQCLLTKKRDEIICQGHPFKRVYKYYLAEEQGKELDRLIPQQNPNMELEFSLPNFGSPKIKNFYIDGQNWEDWYQKQKEK